MTEVEKLAYTKGFIDKLAQGTNPLTGEGIPEGDLLNQVRISRCLSYVSDILRQVIENGGIQCPHPRRQVLPFSLAEGALASFAYDEKGLSLQEIANRVSALAASPDCVALLSRSFQSYLMACGLLQEQKLSDGTVVTGPTELGRMGGIRTETRTVSGQDYRILLYDLQAQMFLLDHIDAIIEINRSLVS